MGAMTRDQAGLAGVAKLIRDRTGIALSRPQEAALRAALKRAAPALEPAGFLAAAADPVQGRALVERLIDEITVQESTFARDRDQLDAISWPALHRAAQADGRRTIRVWSAGCATGEEPYTLALFAAEAFAPLSAPVDVLGTDISRAALTAATAGRYRERAVAAVDSVLRQRYLERQDDGTFGVRDHLRSLVRFRQHNLVRDPVPPHGETGFDLVVCRNVLIYFKAELAGRVIAALERSVCPGGQFILGAADVLQRGAARRADDARKPRPAARTRTAGHHNGAAAGAAAVTGAGPRLPPRLAAPTPPAPGTRPLAAALAAADSGDRDRALSLVESVLADDPLDTDALYLHGLVALEAGNPSQAVESLRSALYTDGSFGLAAFTLGRAYDALGQPAAARRAYERALRLLDPEDNRHELLLQQVDIGDIAAACRARLGG